MKLSSMQRFWLIQAITISLVILTGLSAVQGADTAKDQVAVVNGTVIMRQELENEVTRTKNRMAAPEC